MSGPQIALLPDGRRLHMNHGPIDLIVEAFGTRSEVDAAYAQAAARFQTILTELVAELPDLRRPARSTPRHFAGPTAHRMERAVVPLSETFITPMAAVAGAVADEMLAAMTAGRALSRAYVNDGGDIALCLSPGESLKLAIAGAGNGFADRIAIRHADPVRGIATSGWRGRSFSLGIADAVTVLAPTAAAADAAATIIANAVDLPAHPAIARAPADTLQPDTDLGARLVTTAVGALTADEIAQALSRGAAAAQDLLDRGLIAAAALFLAGEARVVGISHLVQADATRTRLERADPVFVDELPPPLTPPHKGEGERPADSPGTQGANLSAASAPPSPLWGGIKGGGSLAPMPSTRTICCGAPR